ncbi:hypothetical protein ACEQ8H_006597 [Pleosporales sp. CAS-2024a]
MADVGRKRASDGEGVQPMRRRLRPSELPLSQAKRSAIDNLAHTFRKKGHYDSIRKDLLAQYEASSAKDDLLTALKDLVETETDRNPHLLSKDPRMATTLIEGAGERINIYGNIMNTVGSLLDNLIKEQGLPKMREYRIQEIGAEAAAEEEQRGSKTEEEWAAEAEARRQEREAVREKELEHQRQIEREERAKKEERRRREKEQDEAREKARQEEKERRRKEREERDRAEEERRRKERERIDKEREEERARLKKEREEHEANREARLRKIREEDAERERRIKAELERDRGSRYRGGRGRSRTPERDRSRDRRRARDRSRRRSRSRTRSREREHERKTSVKPEDIKVDDDLALQLLLQESEQMKKSRQRPVLERSESLDPPMRKAQPPKSLVPRDPIAARRAKLDSKPQSPAPSPSKEPSTPTGQDVEMEDAPPTERSQDTASRSRWDTKPPLPSKDDKSRGRSRSPSVAHSARTRKRRLKMIENAEMTIGTLTGYATTGTTNVHVAEAAVVLAKPLPVASHATIHGVRHPKIVIMIVAGIEVAPVPVEAVEPANVPLFSAVVVTHDLGAETASTDICPEEVLLKLRLPLQYQMKLRKPRTTRNEVKTVHETTVVLVREKIVDLEEGATLVPVGGAITRVITIAGMVVGKGQIALMSLIGIYPEEATMTRVRVRSHETEVAAVMENGTETADETIVTEDGVQGVGPAAEAVSAVAELKHLGIVMICSS